MSKNKTCRYGSILRKGYTRHLKNKTIRVPSGCIKAQSQSGKKRTTMDLAKMAKRRKIYATMKSYFGKPRCKSGEIVREGYTRKAFVRKTGVRVSRSKVAPGCIKATGLSKKRGTKGKQLFVLEKGTLTQYGYHANLTEDERHHALKKALDYIKPLSVYRKLNALYVLNKNKDSTLAKLYRKDADWIKTTMEYAHRSEY
jgi:hypothetical protein